jgi:hypothetical protein
MLISYQPLSAQKGIAFGREMPGGARRFSIRPEQKSRVERWLGNYQKLRAKLKVICEPNHQLLRAEP